MWPCCIVEGEEDVDEVDANVEVEAREIDGPWVTQSRLVIEQKKIHIAASGVEPHGAPGTTPLPLFSFSSYGQHSHR